MRNILIILAILILTSSLFSAVNADSLQAAIAESMQDKFLRGEILVHAPLMVFPLDSADGKVTWFPVPEMGFRLTPTIGFHGGWFAFPIRIMGMFPFTDDFAALGDASAGAEVHVPPFFHGGLSYRFLRGKVYAVGGEMHSHIIGLDLGLPIEELQGSGVALDWIVNTEIELSGGFTDNDIKWDAYRGNAITLKPYWSFSPGGYGEMILAYRFSILQSFEGFDNETQATYQVGKQSVNILEFQYIYP